MISQGLDIPLESPPRTMSASSHADAASDADADDASDADSHSADVGDESTHEEDLSEDDDMSCADTIGAGTSISIKNCLLDLACVDMASMLITCKTLKLP